MWTDRECRGRRIGIREILSSWAIVALIVLGIVAWDGIQAFMLEPQLQVAQISARADR